MFSLTLLTAWNISDDREAKERCKELLNNGNTHPFIKMRASLLLGVRLERDDISGWKHLQDAKKLCFELFKVVEGEDIGIVLFYGSLVEEGLDARKDDYRQALIDCEMYGALQELDGDSDDEDEDEEDDAYEAD